MLASTILKLINDMNWAFEHYADRPDRLTIYDTALPYCKAWFTALRGGETTGLPRRNACAEHCLQQMLTADRKIAALDPQCEGVGKHLDKQRSYYAGEYQAALAA
jgi:hypothetical protein